MIYVLNSYCLKASFECWVVFLSLTSQTCIHSRFDTDTKKIDLLLMAAYLEVVWQQEGAIIIEWLPISMSSIMLKMLLSYEIMNTDRTLIEK